MDAEEEIVDGVLLDAVAAGSATALGCLYDLYSRRVHAFCLGLTRDAREAEILVAATFHAVWTLGPDLQPVEGGSLECLCRIAALCHEERDPRGAHRSCPN